MNDPVQPKMLKIQRFIALYLKLWNAEEAAHQAGFKWPEKQAHRLMKRPDVQAAVQKALADAGMGSKEVLARLQQMASVNMGDFIILDQKGNYVGLDWQQIKERGYLVKKLTWVKDCPVIELVDSERALELIGKHHKLFTESIDHSGGLKIEVEYVNDPFAASGPARGASED